MITALLLYFAFCAGVIDLIGSIIPLLFNAALGLFFIILIIFVIILFQIRRRNENLKKKDCQ